MTVRDHPSGAAPAQVRRGRARPGLGHTTRAGQRRRPGARGPGTLRYLPTAAEARRPRRRSRSHVAACPGRASYGLSFSLCGHAGRAGSRAQSARARFTDSDCHWQNGVTGGDSDLRRESPGLGTPVRAGTPAPGLSDRPPGVSGAAAAPSLSRRRPTASDAGSEHRHSSCTLTTPGPRTVTVTARARRPAGVGRCQPGAGVRLGVPAPRGGVPAGVAFRAPGPPSPALRPLCRDRPGVH